MVHDTTQDPTSTPQSARQDRLAHALVLVWASGAPGRKGEILRIPRGPSRIRYVFGRGSTGRDATRVRLGFARQRPGHIEWRPPLDNPFVSRDQLELVVDADGLQVTNVGRCAMLIDGTRARDGQLAHGSLLELEGQLLLMSIRRALDMPPLRDASAEPQHGFGMPDAQGIVGESAAAWSLRDRLAFVARRDAHVLLLGESGTGKELAAQAIHQLSRKRTGPLVSRNATTLPSGIADAELFGHARNYPNAGMPERPGLIGEAHEGTLFLDEIGDLPQELQTRLLRVLDARGEYQRLGETGRRTANLRLVGATNRSPDSLREDLAARMPLRIELPSINERREDISLLVDHILRCTAARDPEIGARFFDDWDGHTGTPRVSLPFLRAVVQHDFKTNMRELERLLWTSMTNATGAEISLCESVRAEVHPSVAPTPPTEVGPDAIREALRRHGGKREAVWRELGLANRYILKRLMQKHGIS